MGEELGWDMKRKEQEFDDAMEFLKSMGLPQVSQIASFQAFAHEKQDQESKANGSFLSAHQAQAFRR